MKIQRLILSLALAAVALALSNRVVAASPDATDTAVSPREHVLFDDGWKFHLGDEWPEALHLDKAGASTGPAAEKYYDDSWRVLDLPHDWAIELPFDKTADTSHGFKALGPNFVTNSIGWYRKTFTLPAGDQGKRIWLQFDGVFRDATVWVNGWLVSRHESGYYPFRCDITDIAHFGGNNTVAVRVDATKFEGWFYEGAGIYRHVWLNKTAPLAIAPDGIFVSTPFKHNVPAGKAPVAVEVRLLNTLTNKADVNVRCKILSPDGKTVAKFSEDGEAKAYAMKVVKLEGKVANPQLWSPEDPKLYKLLTEVVADGKVVDCNATEFGIRTVGFDPTNGFLLNGKHYELFGTCNHQDMAGVGAALPDAVQAFRVKALKAFGCNAIRTSHNPPTPELLDACDHLGMIIMDESRLLGSDAANMERWDTQIRRDRNHACVGIWSVANEEFSVQTSVQGGNVAGTMQDYVHHLDPTRPTTYAAPQGDTFEGINGVIQVRGWNYHPGSDMDSYHAKHPQQPNVGTEQASTVSTRGIYENDPQRGYVSAYDTNHPSWATTAETWWTVFADRPWLSGGFVWTGFDYRGEPTPYGWPCINSHFGILDTCGFPKDNFYYYQSWWTTNTVLHLLPHWNWPGKEGQEVRVDALSNCQEVELFLNGESLGKQAMKRNSKLTWQVKYAPGTLSAKGYNDGKVVAETKVETTGDAVTLKLTPDRDIITADGRDVSVITVSAVDAQGRPVPVAQNMIHFDLNGTGKILGVGNGDPSCHEPDTFVPDFPTRMAAENGWRWKVTNVPSRGQKIPAYEEDFDDSKWETTSSEGYNPQLTEGQTAVYRRHVMINSDDLAGMGIKIRFGRIDDLGWVYVNGQRVGESRDWSDTPGFEIKKYLHPEDNVIAVGVRNVASEGGLLMGVSMEFVGQPKPVAWSRSLFNGLAQIMVQSSKDAGAINLTASADGLTSATTTIKTTPVQASAP